MRIGALIPLIVATGVLGDSTSSIPITTTVSPTVFNPSTVDIASATTNPFGTATYTDNVAKPSSPSATNPQIVSSNMGQILKGMTPPRPTATSDAASSSGCAPKYINLFNDVVNGTGRLPKPTSFVKPWGSALVVDNTLFRVVGPNIFWLCQEISSYTGGAVGTYPSKARIREALAIAVAMGGNTVRLTSCSVSLGLGTSLEPKLHKFYADNDEHWDVHDYVIYAAGQYGLRVILPLTDQYDYYTGGLGTFARWEHLANTTQYGAPDAPQNGDTNNATQYQIEFESEKVTEDFLEYIDHYVPHVNKYNGLRYADDPTILAWETGNELGGTGLKHGYPSKEWTSRIIKQIQKHDMNHVIVDGGFGLVDKNRNEVAPGLTNPDVQAVTGHYYPRNVTHLLEEAVASIWYQKPWYIGEYDWTNNHGGDSLLEFLLVVEADILLGDMLWSVFGHDDQCCNFIQHNDGYSVYYPNGNPLDEQLNILLIAQHWHRMTGRLPPLLLPAVACPQPEF